MINVQVNRIRSGDIESFTIIGHAGYAEQGQDIVCAAVSGISFGTINAIYSLLGVELIVEQEEGGFLRCFVPHANLEQNRDVQLLLDGMITSLHSVALEYGQFIKIEDIKKIRRWISC